MKKLPADIILLYIHVYHKWRSYMFLKHKVWQTNFYHFRPFFALSPLTTQKIKTLKLKKTLGDIIILHICTINDNHMIYGSWDTECDRQFFVILDCFLPFYPLMDPENQIFEKIKKIPENIIILQMCNINENHMMYGSWDPGMMDRFFFHFGPFFAHLPS